MNVLYFSYESFNWVAINGVLFWLMLVLRVNIVVECITLPRCPSIIREGKKRVVQLLMAQLPNTTSVAGHRHEMLRQKNFGSIMAIGLR